MAPRLQDPREAAAWLAARSRGALRTDSRQVGPGDAFIAWPGAATDGRRFVGPALAQGAAACLVEADGAEAFGFEDDAVACYAGLKAGCGEIADVFYGQPSERLAVLAVTGTNGKTSTTWWLAQALSAARPEAPCGVVGTLGIGRPPQVESNGLTTPDPVLLQAAFRRFVDQGLGACAIEASSIGLAEHRLAGTRIRVAVFTNFTRDHLDYHGSMEAYRAAKLRLFAWPGLQAAVVNVDDACGAELADSLAGSHLELWTTSCGGEARLRAQDIRHHEQGLAFTVVEGGQAEPLATRLIGHYNVHNLLAVIGSLRAVGVPLAQAVRACDGLLPVPGRMECLRAPGQPLVAIDYAHTPDALDQALAALRPLASARGGELWCVFGCGGDRDATKRPLMGAVAEKNADHVIVTSDNPRSEKPEAIISQVLLGLSQRQAVAVEADRAFAIRKAVEQAAPQDVILLAGKGHEDYQDIAGTKHPFDDRVHARQALQRRAAA
ncbi:UDP-N-acetylmuramoyl-L-alanyl-D-glutamate--2,6-diaminopimelate ligase [Ramlibacter sp. AW1]|uniref:UDP-N-acetylmuramoyl-L-alanyl-D-glutamate--2,6-diaminopimelate ligase n=1 Tax=Ramlibacter aurantiacus TaxID=2801330 RepID=A0A936ZJT8_9BURK|nr:UDP-N-acetylmuramoyl-L-alanyl-D-glutamate--2,6-diaminopimelate ligase [Ramlibacter aurantiacus]MBL0422217.1 UDP-N-acetylmuramoyl-L-alanyl-D-glutamate--2,6-diaminopimelate ligase [Ramlibacter aurantiacus]